MLDSPGLDDRLGWIAIALVGAGLVVWYVLGGSWALFDLLDTVTPVMVLMAVALVLAGIAWVVLRRRDARLTWTTCLLLAFGLALFLAPTLALVNRHLDGSRAREVAFVVQAVRTPTKSPPTLEVVLDGRPARLRRVAGCDEGSQGTAALREGALGLPWVARLSCEPPADPPATRP